MRHPRAKPRGGGDKPDLYPFGEIGFSVRFISWLQLGNDHAIAARLLAVHIEASDPRQSTRVYTPDFLVGRKLVCRDIQYLGHPVDELACLCCHDDLLAQLRVAGDQEVAGNIPLRMRMAREVGCVPHSGPRITPAIGHPKRVSKIWRRNDPRPTDCHR